MLSIDPEKRPNVGELLEFCGVPQVWLSKNPYVAATNYNDEEEKDFESFLLPNSYSALKDDIMKEPMSELSLLECIEANERDEIIGFKLVSGDEVTMGDSEEKQMVHFN